MEWSSRELPSRVKCACVRAHYWMAWWLFSRNRAQGVGPQGKRWWKSLPRTSQGKSPNLHPWIGGNTGPAHPKCMGVSLWSGPRVPPGLQPTSLGYLQHWGSSHLICTSLRWVAEHCTLTSLTHNLACCKRTLHHHLGLGMRG